MRRHAAAALALALLAAPAFADTWRGLTVAPENRCSPYNKKRDYPYPQSVEREIVAELGIVFGPYTGRCFRSIQETDIEHVVAASEAHDSGLCARDRETRRRFARDLRNLTLAAPNVNRVQKSGKDAAEWQPNRNRCWFAARVVEVRQIYGLTIDRREADVLDTILAGCESLEMVKPQECPANAGPPQVPVSVAPPTTRTLNRTDALRLWDDNGNGRITCAEARRHGITPVPRGHPAYPFMRDGDGDGVVCE